MRRDRPLLKERGILLVYGAGAGDRHESPLKIRKCNTLKVIALLLGDKIARL